MCSSAGHIIYASSIEAYYKYLYILREVACVYIKGSTWKYLGLGGEKIIFNLGTRHFVTRTGQSEGAIL